MVTQRWEKVFANQVLESEPRNSSGYVLLSNIYAVASKQHSSAKIKQLRLERHVEKQPRRTWIEVNKQVYSFTVGDQEHPQINGIHVELERLFYLMEESGYVPDTKRLLIRVTTVRLISHCIWTH
jgi:hypothetical protein